MDEIILQMGNYLSVTGEQPDTLIINDYLFTKYLIQAARYVSFDAEDESKEFNMFGLKVIRTHDIKGFKVARLEI